MLLSAINFKNTVLALLQCQYCTVPLLETELWGHHTRTVENPASGLAKMIDPSPDDSDDL